MKECGGCVHSTVCKHRESYEKLNVEIDSDIVEVKCKYFMQFPSTGIGNYNPNTIYIRDAVEQRPFDVAFYDKSIN